MRGAARLGKWARRRLAMTLGDKERTIYVLVLVLDDSAHLQDVLEAWQDAGVPGITVLDSTGVRRIRERLDTGEAPLFMGFSRLLRPCSPSNSTLFALVKDMETIHNAIMGTERIIGDLTQPHTGIAFALPVEAAWGLHSQSGATPARSIDQSR